MALKTFPNLGGGGGGPATITYPLTAPADVVNTAAFAFANGGGVGKSGAGEVYLAAQGGSRALVIDAGGAVALPAALSVSGLTRLLGNLQTPQLTADMATVSGGASIGGNLSVGGSLQVVADLSANKITATAGITGASLTTQGAISGASLSITGATRVGDLQVAGTFTANNLQSEGIFYFPTSSPGEPGLALADQHGTGVFAATGSIGFAVAGSSALSVASNLAVTFAGDVSGQGATFQAVQAGSLQASGATDLAALAADAATFRGNVTAQQALSVGADLTVAGTSRLADLRIDQLSTDHDLAIGGSGSVAHDFQVSGTATLGSLAAGNSTLADTTVANLLLQGARILGGDANNPPVLSVPSGSGGSTTDYCFVLGPNGALAMSNHLYVGGTTELNQATVVNAGLSAASLAASGGVSAGGDVQAGGALTAAGAVTAASSQIGGSSFHTVSGSPNGQLVGAVGDQAIDTQAGTLYLKLSGGGSNAGWLPVSTTANQVTPSWPLLANDSADDQSPAYAFGSDSRAGYGRRQDGSFFFSVGDHVVLEIDGDQDVVHVVGTLHVDSGSSFGGDATFAGNLDVQGALSTGSFSAAHGFFQTTSAGQLTAQATTLASASVTGALAAGATTLSALTVNGATQLNGDLQSTGSLYAATQIRSPKFVVNTAAITCGDGDPNGQLSGNPGDLFIRRDSAVLLQKTDGSANTGWVAFGAANAPPSIRWPLSAPLSGSLAAPSYGFAGSQMGLTDQGANVLVGVTSGAVGWKLDASGAFSTAGAATIAGPLTAQAGLSVAGSATLAATTATALTLTGALTGHAATLDAVSAASLATRSGDITSAGAVSAASALTGATVAANGATWRSDTAAPSDSVGQGGDIFSVRNSDQPLYVRTTAGYKRVALMGDPAPSQFPLRAPADSATAPSYASAGSTGSGMFFPAAGQVGWATGGTQAGYVDGAQKWWLAGAIDAQAAQFTALASSGNLAVTGSTVLGGSLQVNASAVLTGGLTAATLTASGALTVGSAVVNGSLQGNTATFSSDVTVGGSLTVNGQVTYAGLQRSGYYQTGDGTISSVGYGFTSEPGLGLWRPAANTLAAAANNVNMLTLTAATATLSGALRVGGNNAGLTSPGANTLALQTAGTTAVTIASTGIATFAFQAQVPAGTASAPGLGVGGANVGLFSGTDANSRAFLGIAQGGAAVARLLTVTNNSLPVYILGLGDPTSTTTSGGIVASAQLPSTGAPSAFPGMLYQHLGGGAAASLYVNESTTSTPSFAKVLTTSSPAPSPSFPLVGPAGSAAAPTFQVGANNGLFATGSATALAFGGAQVAAFAATLATLPGSLQVGGTNAGLTSPGANSVALQVAGSAALTFAATGVATFAAQAIHAAGSTTAPGLAVGQATTGFSTGTDGSGASAVALTVAGTANALFKTTTANSLPVYTLGLGTLTSTTVGGGILASAQAPGTIAALPGQLFQNLSGGANASLYVNESTGTTPAWVKVLTTSSPAPAPSYPLVGPAGTAAAPTFQAGSGTGTFSATVGSPAATYLGFAAAGSATGASIKYTTSGNGGASTVYALTAGDVSNTTSPRIDVGAGTLTPNGNVGGYGGSLYTVFNGGPGALWLNEGTANNSSSWNKVLTTASTITPTYPLVGPAGTAAAPTFAVNAANTGMYYGTVGSINYVGFSLAGAIAGYVSRYTTTGTGGNSTAYVLVLGDSNASTATSLSNGVLNPNGNVGGAGGAIHSVVNGGIGCCYLNEGTSGSANNWNSILTTGRASLGNAAGTAAAPALTFAVKNHGLYSDGNYPIVSQGGVGCAAFFTNAAGISGYNGISLGLVSAIGTTTPPAYIVGGVANSANAGNPITNQFIASQAALFLNPAGAAGDQIWVHESNTTTNYAAWARVLTETTLQKASVLLQTTAPTAVSGSTRLYATTAGQLVAVSTQQTAQIQQQPTTVAQAASATLTQADNGRTIYATSATQYTITLPAATAGVDQTLRFIVAGTGGVVIKAPAGVIIYSGSAASSSGGTYTGTGQGSAVTLVNPAGAAAWYASAAAAGSWSAA